MTIRRTHHRRGIFIADALIGMALMAAVFSVVIITVHAQRSFAIRMATDREDLRQLRDSMLNLESHQPVAVTIRVHSLPATAPNGWRWADMSLHHVNLIGIVPDSAKLDQ